MYNSCVEGTAKVCPWESKVLFLWLRIFHYFCLMYHYGCCIYNINGLSFIFRLPKPVTAKPLSQTDDEGIHEKDLERVPGLGK